MNRCVFTLSDILFVKKYVIPTPISVISIKLNQRRYSAFRHRKRHTHESCLIIVSGVGGHRNREATAISVLLVCSLYFLPPGSAPEAPAAQSVHIDLLTVRRHCASTDYAC